MEELLTTTLAWWPSREGWVWSISLHRGLHDRRERVMSSSYGLSLQEAVVQQSQVVCSWADWGWAIACQEADSLGCDWVLDRAGG